MITVYVSDKYAHRSMFIIFWLSVSIVGYIILITLENLVVKYLAVILATGGFSPCIATTIAFISGNISPHAKRVTALAFMISVGHIGGVISEQLYRTQDAPRFILGHAINLGFCVLSLVSVVILLFGLRAENRRRDRLYGLTQSSFVLMDPESISNGTEVQCPDTIDIGSEENRRRWGYENMSEQEILDLGDQHAAWRYIL